MSASASKKLLLTGACGVSAAVLCTILMAQQSDRTRLVQSQEEADRKSTGCVACHGQTDSPSMHPTGTVRLGCADCHGGNADIQPPAGAKSGEGPYDQAKKQAHPRPRIASMWRGSANPVRAYANWLKESQEYIQFVNPGDLRVAEQTCGLPGCHVREVRAVQTSMMTHGAMLWQAALYNNGAFIHKDARFGESYSPGGLPQRINMFPPPSQELTRTQGVLPHLDPLARWETSQPGNVLRVFERGAGEARRDRQSKSGRRTRASRRQTERARIRHRASHRSCFSGPAKDAPAGSHSFAARHQRSSGRLSPERLHGLPRYLRQRSFARAFRSLRLFRQPSSQLPDRSHHPAQ